MTKGWSRLFDTTIVVGSQPRTQTGEDLLHDKVNMAELSSSTT